MESVTYGGKASVMFIAERAAPGHHSPEETAAVFAAWKGNFNACLRALRDVQRHMRDLPAYTGERYHLVISLASAASSCLKHDGRLAEAHELLEWMADAMQKRGDSIAAARWHWEKNWILEEWGEPLMPSVRTISVTQPVQLRLEFCE